MKVIFAVLSIAAVASAGLIAPATVISRAPQFDSAVIKSDRLGGNFAYSVAENHAYAAHTPIIQHVAQPVAVSYSAPQLVSQQVVTNYGLGLNQVAYSGLGLGQVGLAQPTVVRVA